jgi:hypothetical protein
MNLREQEARTGFAPGQLANRSAAVLASFRAAARQQTRLQSIEVLQGVQFVYPEQTKDEDSNKAPVSVMLGVIGIAFGGQGRQEGPHQGCSSAWETYGHALTFAQKFRDSDRFPFLAVRPDVPPLRLAKVRAGQSSGCHRRFGLKLPV